MRLVLLASLLVGCSTPPVTVCIVDNANQALQCTKPNGEAFTLPLPQADNYVCMSPEDTEALLNYIKARCPK